MKPNLEEYIIVLKENFGENLTPQAINVAEDFISNYEEFKIQFSINNISIICSSNRLSDAKNDPKYSRYKIYNSLSIISTFITILFLFINWKVSIIIFLIAFVLKIISNIIKKNTSQEFTESLMYELKKDVDEGILKLFINYCAGIVQLKSNLGFAHLPILPSTCLTGKIKYAKNK